jgi:hypothetical protein
VLVLRFIPILFGSIFEAK